jgi:Zn-dependent protease/CBS domain-containing protein
MKANIILGRIFGIEIGLHYSWLIIAVLIVLSLSSYFGSTNPEWGTGLIWAMAVIAAIFFFSAIVIHELSHALVALYYDIPVRSITLFALGGVAQMEKEAESAKTEFWIGIVGPITSFAIGFLCLGVASLVGWPLFGTPETPLMTVLVWLGYVNVALAIFNMVPGFPMDGGRVLRAIIWRVTGNSDRATRGASVVGQSIAVIFILLGIVLFFGGAGIGGLWIAFIGWFLLNAARASYLNVEVTEGLRGVRVADLMSRECAVLGPTVNVQTLVDEHMLRTGQRCFVVADGGGPLGIVTPSEIKTVEVQMRPMKTLADVMRPFESLHTAGPEISAGEALEIMGREDVNQLPVVADGRLLGMISRDQIVRYLYTRKELDI